tara:strand:+ start:121 stop:465 length:345 start_codon:yes stop_codon:yes gene_type:complete
MISFFKINKSFLIYLLIFLIVIPIFGFNFLLNLLGNFLLLIFLIPLLIFLIGLISFNSIRSKLNICDQCGNISLGINNTCTNCGASLGDKNSTNFENFKKPSETTIEVKAEEIN